MIEQTLLISEDDVVKYGPGCYAATHVPTHPDFPPAPIVRAIAWCYEHWVAIQKANDDGWPPQVWYEEDPA